MQTPNTETDKCACADAIPASRRTRRFANRKYYIQGSGQLCNKCYIELYVHKSEDETTVSLDEMNELIRLSRR